MQKDEVIHIAENLFKEAVNAKSYLQIIKQFRENREDYCKEIDCSPAFYNVVYNSLLEGLFLNLFKLYDADGKSLSIYSLFKEMNEIDEANLNDYVLEKYVENGNKFIHPLSLEEEVYFQEEVTRVKNLCRRVKVKYTHTTVCISLKDLVNLYNKRFRPLKKAIGNLVRQRNKFGVHNDGETKFDYKKINQESPLSDNEIEKLVEFAIEFLQFSIEVLTGVHKIPEFLNIDDWELTLNLVRDGMKYRKMKEERSYE